MKEKNIKYRTKQQMLIDSLYILNSPVTDATKYFVLNDVCWQWTEFEGKYKGCKYWSKNAIEELKTLRANNEKFSYSDYFRHEHIVPKKVLIEKILEIKNIDNKTLEDLFNKCLIGAVLTIKEEKDLNRSGYKQKMPKEFFDINNQDYNNEWLRYKKEKIAVKNMIWDNDDFDEGNFIKY